MADITMCKDAECPKRETCYRYQAEPNPYWQSYFRNTPRTGTECEFYYEQKKERDK